MCVLLYFIHCFILHLISKYFLCIILFDFNRKYIYDKFSTGISINYHEKRAARYGHVSFLSDLAHYVVKSIFSASRRTELKLDVFPPKPHQWNLSSQSAKSQYDWHVNRDAAVSCLVGCWWSTSFIFSAIHHAWMIWTFQLWVNISLTAAKIWGNWTKH